MTTDEMILLCSCFQGVGTRSPLCLVVGVATFAAFGKLPLPPPLRLDACRGTANRSWGPLVPAATPPTHPRAVLHQRESIPPSAPSPPPVHPPLLLVTCGVRNVVRQACGRTLARWTFWGPVNEAALCEFWCGQALFRSNGGLLWGFKRRALRTPRSTHRRAHSAFMPPPPPRHWTPGAPARQPTGLSRTPPPHLRPVFGHAGNAWCLYPTLIADV